MSLVTSEPVPVFNIPEFPSYFKGKGESIPLDDQGLMRCLETVLLPESSLTLKKQISEYIWKIETPSYFGEKLYIDKRLVNEQPLKEQPSTNLLSIVDKLKELIETPYLWGGNWPKGIDKMLELYPPTVKLSSLDPKIQNIWQFKGVDCSGLLYYATNGYTPRNTSDLITYKEGLEIENLKKEEIIPLVKPLDLIAWKGHVIIVIDEKTCIESTPEKGVHLCNLFERMEELLKKRKPVNENPSENSFVIRRWYLEGLNSNIMYNTK